MSPYPLPSCYLVGDSISLNYGEFLEAALIGQCTYHRKDGMHEANLNLDDPKGANGGDSRMLRRYLEAWAESNPDKQHTILALNCGLHDIKRYPDTNEIAVGPEEYRENLEAIVTVAPRIADKLLWIRTTPIDDAMHAQRKANFGRFTVDLDTCNRIADEVMSKHGIRIIDLHAFTLSLNDEDTFRDGVHFRQHIMRQQGQWLAGWILASI